MADDKSCPVCGVDGWDNCGHKAEMVAWLFSESAIRGRRPDKEAMQAQLDRMRRAFQEKTKGN